MRAAASIGLCVLALSGAGSSLAAAKLFCCNDENGKQVCGDILPPACYGRAYRELGDNGRTIRNVDAPLTPEQRRLRDEQRKIDEEKRKEEEAALREQRRKDSALLNTYGSERDIDAMRERAEADVKLSIKSAEAKIAEARAQRKKFENEAEFYKKKQLPPEVTKGLNNADFEIKAQESVITSKQKDLDAIRSKYDEDKRRFIALTKGSPTR